MDDEVHAMQSVIAIVFFFLFFLVFTQNHNIDKQRHHLVWVITQFLQWHALTLQVAQILLPLCVPGHQSGFCMICIMQNHIIQAFANTGNAIKPVSFIRELKSKNHIIPNMPL